MADRFFDTSAAAKRYRAEAGTPVVDRLLAEPGSRHLVSALTAVELHSALARLVRTGELSPAGFDLARGQFESDIGSGLWRVVPVAEGRFAEARDLVVRHGRVRPLRTLDALQIAVALSLHAAEPLDAFVCADAALCRVAASEGLTALDPEAS